MACTVNPGHQVAFGPSDAEFRANNVGFRVVLHPEDFVFTACHEGMNRSQVEREIYVNVNELKLGLANTTRNPEGILSHNNIKS